MTPVLLDTVVAIIMILSIVAAFFRGFVKEMLTIVNIAGAAGAAWFLGPQIKPSFADWLGVKEDAAEKAEPIWGVVPPEIMATFLAYGAAFFGVFLVLSLAGMAISSSVKALGLGPVDKALGLVFGAARGFLLVFLIYAPFGYFMPPADNEYPKWAKDSVTFAAVDAAYVWAEEKFGDKDEDADTAETAEAEDGPLTQRLKKMGDDMMQESIDAANAAERSYASDDMRDDLHDALRDDERTTP